MDMGKNNQFTGYILAGGKSSRMGQNKGLLDFHGKSLMALTIEKMSSIFDEVVIVSNNTEYDNLGCQFISDLITNAGPAGGIHSALMHSKTKFNFMVSCDMPFISTEGIEFIIAHSFENEITIPVKNGFIEPLFGVYASRCKNKWEELIQSDHFKLSDIISHLNADYISVENVKVFDTHFFLNMNTKSDYLTALKIMKRII